MAEPLQIGNQKRHSLKSTTVVAPQQLPQNSFEALWKINPKAKSIDANSCFYDMLGYTHNEIITLKLSDVFDQKGLSEIRQHLSNPQQHVAAPIECLLKHKDQTRVWAALRLEHEQDLDGNITASIIHIIDITQQKEQQRIFAIITKAQSTLAQLDDELVIYDALTSLLHEIVGTGYIGAIKVNQDNGIISIVNLKGIGQSYYDLVNAFNVDPVKISYPLKHASDYELNAFRKGELCPFEGGLYHLLMKKVPKFVCRAVEDTMQIRKIHIMGMVSEDYFFGGVVIMTESNCSLPISAIETVINHATQVIKRVRSENELRRSEQRLQLTFDAIDDGYWDWDIPSGKITVNAQWFEMLGYRSHEFEPTYDNFVKLLHPEEAKKNISLINDSLARDGFYSLEFRLKTKTGEYKWIHARGRTIAKDENGTAIRMVGTQTDISARKQHEQDQLTFYETQRQLVQVTNLDDLYRLVGNCLQKLIPEGYSVFTRFDQDTKSIRVVGLYGFGKNPETLLKKFNLSTSSLDVNLDNIEDKNLRLWQSNKLEKFNGGVYELLTKKVPLPVCQLLEKQMAITETFIMGCQWNNQDYGGFVLLTKKGLGQNKELIETLINDTAIAIQRIITEEQVQIAQKRYRNIFEKSPVGIITFLPNLKLISANDEFCNISGFSQDELREMSLADIIPSEQLKTQHQSLKKLISGKLDSINVIEKYRLKNKQTIWARVMVNKIKDSNGKLLYLLAMVTNITNEKNAEEALNQNRRFLEMVLNTIPNLVFVRDDHGRYTMANQSYANAMGLSSQTIIGKTDRDFIGRDQLVAQIRTQDHEVLTSRKPLVIPDMEMSFPLMRDRIMQFVKIALPENNLTRPSVLGVITDITDQKLAEQALLENEHKYRLLFETMRQGAFYQQNDGTLIDINPAAVEIFGYTKEEINDRMTGKVPWHLRDENGKAIPRSEEPSIVAATTGQPVYSKTINFDNDYSGREVWVVVNAIPQFRNNETVPFQVYVTVHDITTIKQVEKELRISELRYRTLIHHLPVGVYQADESGGYVYFNDRLCQMSSLTLDQMRGDGWKASLHPEDRQRVLASWNNFISSGGKWSCEYRLTDKHNRRLVWIIDEASALYDDAGKIIGFLGSKFDLSERKESELELQQSENKYRLLTENMKDVVWILDTATMHFTYLSPSINSLRGFTPEEVMANPLSAALTEEGAEYFKNIITQKIRDYHTGRITASDYFTYEIPQTRKDGSIIWTEVIASLHENPVTHHLDLHGVTREITDRKLAEKALQKSEEKHRLLIENSHEIIYTLSLTGELTFISNAWKIILGIPSDDLIGSQFSHILHQEDQKSFANALETALQSDESQTGIDFRVKHADGTWRWLDSSILPIYNERGECIGVEGTAHDITEQKITEEALQESEERYRLLVEQSPVGIMIVQKGKFVYANKTGLRLFGYDTLTDFLNTKVLDTIHPDSRNVLMKEISKIIHGSPSDMIEITIKKKNGQACTTETTSAQIHLRGEPATLVFAQDISNRKNAEIQLRKYADDLTLLKELNESVNRGDPLQKSLKYLLENTKRIFSSNGASVYLVSPDREYLELQSLQLPSEITNWIESKIKFKIPAVRIRLKSDSLYRKILEQKSFQTFEDPQNIIRMMQEFTESPVLGKLIPAIFKKLNNRTVVAIPLIVKGESVGLLELSSKEAFDPQDLQRLEFISSELGSIIRRRQAEEALRESEENFRQIVERSNDIFMRQKYATLEFEYISPTINQILGYTQEQALSFSPEIINQLIHPDDRIQFSRFRRALLEENQKGNNSYVREFRVKNQQGDYVWFTANYALVHDDQNEPKLVIATLTNITNRKIKENILGFRVKLQLLSSQLNIEELQTAILDEIGNMTESKVSHYHLLDENQSAITQNSYSSSFTITPEEPIDLQDPKKSIDPEIFTFLKQSGPILLDQNTNFPCRQGCEVFKAGIDQGMVIPTIRDNRLVSVLCVGNKDPEYTSLYLEYLNTLADIAWDAIENKLTQNALQQSETIFNAFLEYSPIYVFFKDKEIRSKKLSRNFEQMLGKPLDELLDKNMDELFPGEFAKNMIEDDKRILESGNSIVVDEELGGKHYTTIKFPILKDGKPEYLAGFTIDITDRVIAQKKLAESEELYRVISSVISDYLFSTRIDKNNQLSLQWVAGAFESMTGYTMAEYSEHGGWRAMVYPEDLPIDDRDMAALQQNKKVISEIRTVRKNGDVLWVRVYAQPIWDPTTQQLVGIDGAVQDITERKLIEEKVKKSAAEFETLYKTAKDFSLHRDPNVILKTIADRTTQLFESVNTFVYFYNPDSDNLELKFSREPVNSDLMTIKMGVGLSGTVAQTLKPVNVSDYGKIPDQLEATKEYRPSAMMIVPLVYAGQLLGVLGVTRGIENHHSFSDNDLNFLGLYASQAAGALYSADLFEKLRLNAVELEKRVDERTRELQTKNKELETFTYTVSHDLKAPLRGISGYSTLLMEDYAAKLDDEGKRYLTNLVNSTERMNLLIEDLLAYSKVERREIKKTTIDLEGMVDKILVEYQPDIQEGKIQFIKEIECGTVFTDQEALMQALRNIIDNAVKFTSGRNLPTIIINAQKLEDHYLISVEDNGIGFDMKYYDKIFEIFQRLHLPEDYPGTGVGLAVVRKAIEHLGGKIWAVSKPDVGSTFFMELPL